MTDNYLTYGQPAPWKTRQARWNVKDLTLAIRLQCNFCNQVQSWNEVNDCVSPACPLFPFRPGEQRPSVQGISRAARRKASGRPLKAGNDARRHNQPARRRENR